MGIKDYREREVVMQVDPVKIDVIVPVYNEEEIIDTFYRRLKNVPLKMNFIFIDNASADSTVARIQKYEDVILIQHETNEGYGGSLIDGITHSSGDILVIIDADCEYPPESIPEMVEALKSHNVVYGSRFLHRRPLNMSATRTFGNKLISFMFNRLFHQNTTDLYTGFKALRRSALKGIILEKKGFEHVLELGVKLSKKGIPISEIPIDYVPRQTGQSKMKHVKETLTFLYRLFHYKFLNKSHAGGERSNG
jgi:glycosyltransferase involved in cell wall biosynthesis